MSVEEKGISWRGWDLDFSNAKKQYFGSNCFMGVVNMEAGKSSREVLIVEDDREIRKLLSNFLKEKEMIVTEAGDGD